jgi:hypothetical protein
MPMVEEIDAPPGASAKAVSYNMNTGTFESKDCGRTEEVIAHEFEEMMSAVHQYKEVKTMPLLSALARLAAC